MSASSHGGAESQLDLETVAVGEDATVPSTSGGDSPRFSLVDDGNLVEARVSEEKDVLSASKIENEGAVICDVSGGDNLPSPSISSGQYNALKKTDSGNVKSEHKKVKSAPDDYDSMLSEFDQFASKRLSEAVGYGYEIADMVWGKVKSHPWWPGRIYNEAFASPSVQRSKREEGHVLVAFFGDSSYGWFDPSELVPFEDNFAEKSRESSSRSFQKALQEAVDELSRRRSLGLLCRCRNKFNFWPSSVKGYFAVDVGEVEPVVYSTGQINKARESFHPNEMLSFVMQLALTPMTHQHWTLDFIKNKATILACRKALFEEFDETYAQAFGSVISTPRPSAPVAMDPSKVPLSGRLVIAESLGKRKVSVKPTKSKDQLEKDKYMFKRRDEPTPKKTKKAGPLLVDGPRLSGIPLDSVMKGNMHQISVSDINDGLVQPMNYAYVINDIKPSQGSMKHVEAGMTKPKLHKQRAGELSTENATPVAKKKRKKEISMGENVIPVEKMKKRKKEIKNEASAVAANLPLSNSDSGVSLEKASGILLDVPPITSNNQPDNQKNDDLLVSSYPLETKQAVNHGRVELAVLVKDMCALAVNAFHGMERNCLATTRVVVLKYRSLVFQKSLVSSPPTESETTEANLRIATDEKSTMKPARPLGRPDDPTKGGKKRVLSDSPESIKKKKKLGDLEETNKRKKLEDNTRKKLIDSEVVKKKNNKKLDESKQLSLEKKIPQRPSQSLIPPKVVKVEPSKRMEHPGKTRNPTMLVMKFPAGANLPSGAHLRAKFARFGPLDLAATRVFWKTYTCRLVFHQKVHAETALKFAQESGDLFGNVNVRYYIREVGESAESEAMKAGQKEEPSASSVVKIGVQAHQQQLKSCLKKGSGEEVGNGNGNGRGTSRVKFILGGEGSSKSEHVSSYSMDVGPSKKLPKIVGHSNVSPLPFPSNVVFSAQQIPDAPKNDISQQLLNLLARCNDVVNNLTGVLGYVPYHPL